MSDKTIVTIKSVFCEKEELGVEYFIAEDNGDRVLISPMETTMTIVPQELVLRSMLNFKGDTK